MIIILRPYRHQIQAGLACVEVFADFRKSHVGDREIQVRDAGNRDQSEEDQGLILRELTFSVIPHSSHPIGHRPDGSSLEGVKCEMLESL